MLLGVAFVGIVFYWTLQQYNAVSLTSSGGIKADMGRFADVAMYSCWRWCSSPCWRSASGAAATFPRPTCRACA